MLAGVGAFFEVDVDFAPRDYSDGVAARRVQAAQARDEQAVGLFFHVVDVYDVRVQRLRVAEVGEFAEHQLRLFADAYDYVDELERVQSGDEALENEER